MAHRLIHFRYGDEAKKQRRRDQINAARHRRKAEGRGEFSTPGRGALKELDAARHGTPPAHQPGKVTLPYVSFIDPAKRHEWELDVAPPIRGRAAAVEAPCAEDVDPKSSITARAERVKVDA